MLLPVPFAPALILVQARRTLRPTAASRALGRALPAVVATAIVIGVLALLTPLPDPTVLAGLVVIAFLAGFELRVDARGPIPPMVATLVVVAVVVGGNAALAGAVVVAVIATGTAWVLVQGDRWWAPVLAAGAAAAAAVVFDARPSRVGALAAALVFELLVVAGVRRIVWSAPLVCSRDCPRLRVGGDRRRGCVGVRCRRAGNGGGGGRVGRTPVGKPCARAVGRAPPNCRTPSVSVGHRGAVLRAGDRSPDRRDGGSPGARIARRGCRSRRRGHGDGRSAPMAVCAAATRRRRRVAPRVLPGHAPRVSVCCLEGRRMVGRDPRRRARGLRCGRMAHRPSRRCGGGLCRDTRPRGCTSAMTPRLASRHVEPSVPRRLGATVDAPGDSGSWRWFAVGLFAVGFAIGVALIVSGSTAPATGSRTRAGRVRDVRREPLRVLPRRARGHRRSRGVRCCHCGVPARQRVRRAVVRRLSRRPARHPALAAALVRAHGLQRGEPDGRDPCRCRHVHRSAASRRTPLQRYTDILGDRGCCARRVPGVRAGGRCRRRRAHAAAATASRGGRQRASSSRWKRSPFPLRWSARVPDTSPPKWVGGRRSWCSHPPCSFRSSRSPDPGAARRPHGSRSRFFPPRPVWRCSRSSRRCPRRQRSWRWWRSRASPASSCEWTSPSHRSSPQSWPPRW